MDCINILEKENSTTYWKLTLLHSERPKLDTILVFLSAIGLIRNSKGFSLVVKTFAATNVTPLKDGFTASEGQPAGNQDKSTNDLPLSKPRQKKKSPFKIGSDHARRQWFWKQKRSVQTSPLNAQLSSVDTILEQEKPIQTDLECSSSAKAICVIPKDTAVGSQVSDCDDETADSAPDKKG